jgi:hypothetical protein
MMRALAVAIVLLSVPALAKGSKHKRKAPTPAQVAHPFAETPIAKLTVTDTKGERAVVEDKQGAVVLVSAGDLLGSESFKVTKITRGCISLSGPDTELVLCADRPEVPQT